MLVKLQRGPITLAKRNSIAGTFLELRKILRAVFLHNTSENLLLEIT